MKPPAFLSKLPVKAIHNAERNHRLKRDGWRIYTLCDVERREVIVSATDGPYAIVRRKGCIRYICPVSELDPL